MRVFISSIPAELEPHQAAACEVAHELDFEPVLRDPTAGRGLDPVTSCARQVAAADLVLAIVGWRRGRIPPPELGGDGLRPWTFWEVRSAFERGKPVVVLMAGERWRPELREDDAGSHAVMQDFRGELDRLAVFFDDEPADADASRSLSGFRELVRRQLLEARRDTRSAPAAGPSAAGVRLRRWPPPKLPERPYPVLLPYTHPDLLGGRGRELELVRRLLQLPVPIVGLYAPSGAGKSSLLAGGLVPGLRAGGRPVAFDRHPCEAGIAGRLIGDLLASEKLELADEDPHAFVDQLLVVRGLAAGELPVLVLDQFEDLLHRWEARRARAVVGALLAATVQRLPGLDGPPCRWLLAYRQEFHGQVFLWLADVLRDARAEGLAAVENLPHDLSEPARFHGWPLPPLGTPTPGTSDRAGEAAKVFLAAIEKPLHLATPQGTQRFPWRFAGDGAARLARAFGEARAARSEAPLAPELQVVLAHLLARSDEPDDGGSVVVEVPDEPGALIDRAFEEHLRRALDGAFPTGGPALRRKRDARSADPRIGRTRALLALRELADVHGRREGGLPVDSLARAVGTEGREVLEKLATPQARLVVIEERADGWCYVLSHDRMAEVLVRLVDDEGAYAGLGVDAELLSVRRFVTLQSELFAAGEVAQATEVPAAHFRRIEEHAEALLWGEERRRWWAACRERRRSRRRRSLMRRGIAAAVVVLVALGAWTWADRRGKRLALLEQVAEEGPAAAFAALARLTAEPGADAGELLEQMRQREKPLDILERGLNGVGEELRGEAVLRVAEVALPLLEETPEDPVLIASIVWALDFFAAREPALKERASALRDRVLGPLRQSRPPPALPECRGSGPSAAGSEDPDWADIPGGTFIPDDWWRGGPGAGRDEENNADERLMYHVRISISTFRMKRHRVTNAEYRRLIPEHQGEDGLPATDMAWYQAYTYAAWMGGRLPTAWEWEYAARAGCAYAYCRRDGSEATVDDVARWVGNATHSNSPEASKKPVEQLEPNPWGLFDILGSDSEMNANLARGIPVDFEVDPPGPAGSATGYRAVRRITWVAAELVVANGLIDPDRSGTGIRVALPACSSAGHSATGGQE